MIENIKYLVADTNVLVNGIVLGEKTSLGVVKLLDQNTIKLAITDSIFNEYVKVFNRQKTQGDIPITSANRSQLNKILKNAHELHHRNSSGKLADLGNVVQTSAMEKDYKFIIAADQLAGETKKPGIIISNDTDITLLSSDLARVRILAMTSYSFLDTFLPSYPH